MQTVIDTMYDPCDQPEVVELSDEDGVRQWRLAVNLLEAKNGLALRLVGDASGRLGSDGLVDIPFI
jgi:hypothetical protein